LKKLTLIVFILFILISFTNKSSAWWFSKTDKEYLADAIKSTNSKKVAKCLDRQIKIKNFPGILQIRQHAQKIIRIERNKINSSKGISPKELQKNIAPWLQIEQKAVQFYKTSVK